jgi:enoyl-CoA hydratase
VVNQREESKMESIAIETRGDIAIMKLQRGKASALDMEFTQEIMDTLGTLARSPSSAVVLTGSGTIFSAGVDLIRLQSGGTSYIERFVPILSKLVLALFEFPKPLIAAVNGHAVAGGCVMACAADYRIMARGSGRIGVPELLVGLPFPTAALEVVRYVVPAHNLRTVVYDAGTYNADEALGVGLVDEVCATEELLARAVSRAEKLAVLPAPAFALTKRQVQAPVMERIAAGAAHDAEAAALWRHPDSLERVRRYVERTFKPASTPG